MYNYLVWAATLSLPILYLIETLTWNVKALGKNDEIGKVISLTNIWLYSSRFFFFIYASIVYFLIEVGLSSKEIYTLLLYSLLLSIISHLFLLNQKVANVISFAIARALRINAVSHEHLIEKIDYRVLLLGGVAVVMFSTAIIAPVIFALTYPQYRLSFASVGQLFNAIGSLTMLIFVDPILYKAMDKGDLYKKMKSYCLGRLLGFSVGMLGIYVASYFS